MQQLIEINVIIMAAEVEGMPAWTARLSSNVLPQYAVAIASSNLWPGAHSYAVGRLVGLPM